MTASLIILWDDYDMTASWRDFTGAGMFTNHDHARGRTLYGAEAMVAPSMQGGGIGKKLYAARRELVERLWILSARTDARFEPIACGEREWLEDDSRAVLEIARREGVSIPYLPRAA